MSLQVESFPGPLPSDAGKAAISLHALLGQAARHLQLKFTSTDPIDFTQPVPVYTINSADVKRGQLARATQTVWRAILIQEAQPISVADYVPGASSPVGFAGQEIAVALTAALDAAEEMIGRGRDYFVRVLAISDLHLEYVWLTRGSDNVFVPERDGANLSLRPYLMSFLEIQNAVTNKLSSAGASSQFVNRPPPSGAVKGSGSGFL